MFENNVMEKPFPVNLYQAITGTDTMPVDGSGTLFYTLEFLAPKNKQLLLQRYKEGFSFRKIGVLNEISGARVERVIADTVDQLKANSDLLKNGVMATIRKMSEECSKETAERLEATCRDKYTKEGYQMGYADGITKREKAFYSYGRYDEITIDDLELSHRSYYALQKNGIHTVSDIINVGNGLDKIDNIGKKSLNEIIEKLNDLGVNIDKHFKRIILKYDIKIFFADN